MTMATQAERIAILEVHHEHVDKTLTAMGGTLDAVRAEVAEVRVILTDEIAGVRTMVHNEITDVRTHLDDRLDRIDERFERMDDRFDRTDERLGRIQNVNADARVARSEPKFRVALRVIGWLAGVVIAVVGVVVGSLFVFARFLLPKLLELASLAPDAAPLVG